MSSLWTPEGEHKVPRPGEPPAEEGQNRSPAGGTPSPGSTSGGQPPGSPAVPDGTRGPGRDGDPTPQEIQELAEALAATPAEDIVANHCYGLFELAALHLSNQPPNIEAARLAIDAMGLLVDGLGGRLGAAAETLKEGITQLRFAFVKISDGPS